MSLQFNMVEVFQTTVSNTRQAKLLQQNILVRYPDLQINFDLQDCDNILRIVYEKELNRPGIEAISNRMGIRIKVLDE